VSSWNGYIATWKGARDVAPCVGSSRAFLSEFFSDRHDVTQVKRSVTFSYTAQVRLRGGINVNGTCYFRQSPSIHVI
jgi:hypothetical protein